MNRVLLSNLTHTPEEQAEEIDFQRYFPEDLELECLRQLNQQPESATSDSSEPRPFPTTCLEALRLKQKAAAPELAKEKQQELAAEQDEQDYKKRLRKYAQFARQRALLILAIGLCFLAALAFNSLIQTTIQNASPDNQSSNGIAVIAIAQISFCITLVVVIVLVLVFAGNRLLDQIPKKRVPPRYVLIKPDVYEPIRPAPSESSRPGATLVV